MTVSSSTNRNDYTGNGSTTSFAVSFRFLENSHIKATLRDASGGETLQVETTNYTLTGAGDAGGGTLVMLVAPPSGETLTIQRDVPATQETDYVENDEFPAESHEDALDKLTMLVQQQGEDSTRHIGFTDTVEDATGSAVELSQDATQRADKFLGFDSAGDIVTKTASDAGLVDQDQQDKRYGPIFATVAAMVAANPVSIDGEIATLVSGMTVTAQGYTAATDEGGSVYLVRTSAEFGGSPDELGDHTLANGNVAVLQKSGSVSVLQYGAFNDDTNETLTQAACQACLDANIHTLFPPGKYKVTSLVPKPNTTIEGVRNADYLTDNDINTTITSSNAKIFDVTGLVKGVTFKSLTIVGNVATSSGITGGGQSIQVESCQILSCLVGVGDSTNPCNIYSISNSHLHSCGRGTRDLIDSHIINNYIYNNTLDGIFLGAGHNDVSIIGNKIEFNGVNNINAFQVGNLVVTGNILDRSTDAGISLSGCTSFTVTGNKFRRSGAGDTSGTWAHFYLLNNTDGIIANNATNTGDKDDTPPSGVIVPRYVVIDAGGNTDCLITGNGGEGTTGFIQRTTSSNEGVQLFNNRSFRNRLMNEVDAQTITASGGTKAFTFLIPVMAANTQYNRKLYLTVRDAGGAIFTGKQEIIVQRFGAAASVVAGALEDSAGAVSYAGAMAHAYTADETTGIVTLTITNNRVTDATVSMEWQ